MFFEYYQRTINGDVLNDNIAFKDTCNPQIVADPLLDNLFAVKGCTLSSMHVMMKYHQADAKARHRIITAVDKSDTDGIKQSEEDEDKQIQNFVMTISNKELSEHRLYKFAGGELHYKHIIKHYSGFLLISNDVITPEEEEAVYIKFSETFPTCHAVFLYRIGVIIPCPTGYPDQGIPT